MSSAPVHLVRLAILAGMALFLIGCAEELDALAEPTPSPPPAPPATEVDPPPDPPAAPEVEAPDPAAVEVEPAPVPELTQPDRWKPGPGEVYPEAKMLAAAVAQGLTTYAHGSTRDEVAAAADVPHLAGVLGGLVDPEAASAGTVVYPQLGGVTADSMSVMVVVHQVRQREGGERTEETRTLDLRLGQLEGSWQVAALVDDGGPPVERPADLPQAAAQVVDHPRIELPDSARWDIYGGVVHEDLLRLLLEVAELHEIHAVTLATGHPHRVFGTERQSNHSRGLAIDIYAVDGVPVVEQHEPGSPAHRLAGWLFDRGVPELGAPWAFDGFGGRSFTDVVHHDHLHIGVHRPQD